MNFSFGRQALLTASTILPILVLVLAGYWHSGLLVACAGMVTALAVGVIAWRWLSDAREVVNYLGRLASGGHAVAPSLRTDIWRTTASALSNVESKWRQESKDKTALAVSYETTLDSIPDPLLQLDELGRIVGANMAARSVLGRDPCGSDIRSVLRIPALLEAVGRVLDGRPKDEAEFTFPAPHDRIFVARLKRLPVPGLGGARLVVAMHDITGLRNNERMRAEFVANASHELRTPLAGLLGYIETLAGPARDDKEALERFLPIMQQLGNRMARLIEDLLSLSRIEFDQRTKPTDPVDLREIARHVIDCLAGQARARNMQIDCSVDPDLPSVPGQMDQLTQVVKNLLDNAIKYGHAGTVVSLSITRSAKPDEQQVTIEIRDRGEGIAPADLPRLTERFYRCNTARSREAGGTGLGLAIVKHIVARHCGNLVIESKLGEGSRFAVHLPAFQPSVPVQTATARAG